MSKVVEATVQKTDDNSGSNSTAVDNHYFYEDLVYKINGKKVSFGIVVDNFEDYNSDSGDNEFESSPLPKGSVRVSWYPRRSEQVVKEQTVGLADRSLMPGDVVRKLVQESPNDSQHGYCREITVTADVQQVRSHNVLCNVAYSRLVPLNRFEVDLVACLGPWVGTVKEHFTLLTLAVIPYSKSLKMNIIGRLEFTHSNGCNLKSVEKRSLNFDDCEDCEHYVGQILSGKISGLKRWRWLSGPSEVENTAKRYHFIVESVKTVAVGVRWHCQSFLETNEQNVHQPPEYLISGVPLESLKILNVFEACTAQVGDRRFFKVNESDKIITKKEWIKTQSRKFRCFNSLTKCSSQPSLKPPDQISIDNNIHVDASDEGEWSTDDSDYSFASGSTSSGAAASTAVKKKGLVLATKVLKRKIKKERKSRPILAKAITDNSEPPKPGEPTLVETLCTSSVATVVWQDGTIEKGIQSTDLFPIHHLDDQEFFPGDFVIRNNSLTNDRQDLRDYGVIQHMNHAGRTALVKWFRAYSALSNYYNSEINSPSTHGESEVSVYDLKDHPDFSFRPGTVVIRVAGCVKGQSTAGQVLDNFPEGRISVKWVDGTHSMCWPQDLYRVGDYDSDEGELWDEDDDISLEVSNDASWETQSVDSLPGDVSLNTDGALRYRLATNIERSCDAMSRLEDMFTRNPALQGRDVMRTLLEVYKDCRYLDKLMGTSIFHEKYFTDLLERAKTQDQKSTPTQKMQRHFQRLFSNDNLASATSTPNKHETFNGQTETDLDACRELCAAVAAGSKSDNVFTDSVKMTKMKTEAEDFIKENRDKNWKSSSDSTITPIVKTAEILTNIENVQDSIKNAFEKDQKSEVPKDIALQNKPAELSLKILTNPEDLILKTLFEKGVSTSANVDENTSKAKSEPEHSSNNPDNIIQIANACKDLCALIKSRLVIAHAEVLKRLGTVTQTLKNESEDETEPKENEDSYETSPVSSPSATTIKETSSSTDKESNVIPEGFLVLEHAPMSHKYYLSVVHPSESQAWVRAVRREFRLLNRALPPGVWVRGYEDRLDILSLMIRGPADTPYENGLFFFDIQLGANYPASAPLFHYISYCSDRLNPNLYEDGKVCVSLLGTWSGRGSEVWGADSTLLQVIVSVQGLILNTEPYYNEAGYEKQRGSTLGKENSRMYNEMVTLKLVEAMTKLLQSPPEIFKAEIHHHFKNNSAELLERLENLLVLTNEHNVKIKSSGSQVNIGTNTNDDSSSKMNNNKVAEVEDNLPSEPSPIKMPAFPLVPASKGFCLSLKSSLPIFKEVLKKLNLYSENKF